MKEDGEKIYLVLDSRSDNQIIAKSFKSIEGCFSYFNEILQEYNLVDKDDSGLVVSPGNGWGYIGSTIEDLFNEMLASGKGFKYHSGHIYVKPVEVQ